MLGGQRCLSRKVGKLKSDAISRGLCAGEGEKTDFMEVVLARYQVEMMGRVELICLGKVLAAVPLDSKGSR
jgi:hypothetical protein